LASVGGAFGAKRPQVQIVSSVVFDGMAVPLSAVDKSMMDGPWQ
jgi:hypothetical protein